MRWLATFLASTPPPCMTPELSLASDEQLLRWLSKVARRADELGRWTCGARDADRRAWLRAELEIFELAERMVPAAFAAR